MPSSAQAPYISVIAPAKINLYLHVTGRRDDGYHLLDSLMVFADVADLITIHAASRFSFSIEGAYASAFSAADKDESKDSKNLAVRAAYACAAHFNRKLDFRVTLAKNVPLASGIGGGSADAAAVIWGLIRFWGLKPPPLSTLMPLLLSLGADVPVCYLCHAAHVTGIGEKLFPIEHLPEWHAVLVNPRQSCPTPEIFKAYKEGGAAFSAPVKLPDDIDDRRGLLDFIREQGNDLQDAAINKIPAINDVINKLQQTVNVELVRMSGSGATVFALYPDSESAAQTVEMIQAQHPSWWVRACVLNRVVRY
jgi:4-diphosphocytidyl-2-C-methyl-D-erythritol kinase